MGWLSDYVTKLVVSPKPEDHALAKSIIAIVPIILLIILYLAIGIIIGTVVRFGQLRHWWS